jgi:hypothetical protein
MLFTLVMECFHAMIKKDESFGLRHILGWNNFKLRASLYANDVVSLFSPSSRI